MQRNCQEILDDVSEIKAKTPYYKPTHPVGLEGIWYQDIYVDSVDLETQTVMVSIGNGAIISRPINAIFCLINHGKFSYKK